MLILYKKYKTDGLYAYGIIATFISCIMSLKQIDIMGISIPIGFASTISIIIAGNLITQKRGPEELKTYLSLILITALTSCCFLNLSGLAESSQYNEIANKSYYDRMMANNPHYAELEKAFFDCITQTFDIFDCITPTFDINDKDILQQILTAQQERIATYINERYGSYLSKLLEQYDYDLQDNNRSPKR